MKDALLRVALVGCGQIADAHLQEIRKIESAKLVGVCDRYPDLARQAAVRFEVPGIFCDVEQMMQEAKPEVVHVTTPPHTHLPLAMLLFKAGAHVYVEKPFTPTIEEADELLKAAATYGKQVCVGHDQLFDPIWLQCRQMISDGVLGDVMHIESVQGYSLSGPFGEVLSSDLEHWVHRLPGGLFQNVISHPLYRITDLTDDEQPQIWATWFGHNQKHDFPSELRVMMRGRRVTATLLFSSRMQPVQRVVRIFGTRSGIEVDLDGQVIRRMWAAKMPGAFAKLEAPARHLTEALGSLKKNVGRFLRSEIHYFGGMNRLFREFYASISNGAPAPIPPAEIRRVTAIMDQIFCQCRNGRGS